MYPAFIIFDFGPLVFILLAEWVHYCWMALWYARRHWRRVILSLLLYVSTYIALSMNGNYVLANHGGAHYTRSWTTPLVVESFVTILPHIRPGPLAAVYWPLFVVDIWLWHPSIEPMEGYYAAWCPQGKVGPLAC